MMGQPKESGFYLTSFICMPTSQSRWERSSLPLAWKGPTQAKALQELGGKYKTQVLGFGLKCVLRNGQPGGRRKWGGLHVRLWLEKSQGKVGGCHHMVTLVPQIWRLRGGRWEG